MLNYFLYESCSQDYNNENNSFSILSPYDLNDDGIFLNEEKNEINPPLIIPIKFYEDISTAFKTNSNYYCNNNQKESEKDSLPNFNSIDFIIDYLNKYINDEEIKKKLLEEIPFIKNTEDYEMIHLTRKKRKREKKKEKEKEKEKISQNLEMDIQNSKIKKRGRKKEKNKHLNKIHGKKSPDNILKKIKSKIFKYILKFLNKVLNLDNENKLEKFDHSFINILKRETELNLFDKTLSEIIISLKISSKFKTKPPNHNQIIIDKIKNRELSSNNYQTNEFVLNITYDDFIQLFTHRKNIEDLKNVYIYNNINYEKIKENFPFVETLIYELCKEKNNDYNYICLLLFYLYNLKRSIMLKQIRVLATQNEEK